MPVTITCESCGISVTRPKGDEGRGRFCSSKCARAAQTFPSREERFWKKVQKSEECWLWTGGLNSRSRWPGFRYGLLSTGSRENHRKELAHRVSWEIHNGPIPPGAFVCHRCDNPICVRPDHLFIGSAADNADDRDQKGRQRPGKTRLTPYLVSEIRRRRANGEKVQVLADDYGISTGHVSNIANRRWWRNTSDS
jgi:hypothetical protein